MEGNLLSMNMKDFKKHFKQQTIYFLLKISKYLKNENRIVKFEPLSTTNGAELFTVSYNICKTPFDVVILSYNHFPHKFPIWYHPINVAFIDKTFLEISHFITINLNIQKNDIFSFSIYKNNIVLREIMNKTNENRIIETVIYGKENSLFKQHYPKGIDISSIGNALFDHFDVNVDLLDVYSNNRKSQSQNVNENGKLVIKDCLPFLFDTVLLNKVPYPENSVQINLLLDDTFDVITLYCDDYWGKTQYVYANVI